MAQRYEVYAYASQVLWSNGAPSSPLRKRGGRTWSELQIASASGAKYHTANEEHGGRCQKLGTWLKTVGIDYTVLHLKDVARAKRFYWTYTSGSSGGI